MLNNLDQLIELIKQINPNKDTKYIWNMTWSYPNGSTHPCFVDFNNDQAIMDKGILDNIIEHIIPNKTFIRGQRVKTLPIDDWNSSDEEIIKELIKPFEIKEEKDYGSRFISYSTSQSIS